MEKYFKKALITEEVEDHLLKKISVSPDMPCIFSRSCKLWGLGKLMSPLSQREKPGGMQWLPGPVCRSMCT